MVPVHLYGNTCAMDAINDFAQQHHLIVIEDTAEAAFSKYQNTYAGALGNIGCFSFQATKTLTTGEGGGVCFHDRELHDRARLIRNHGMQPDRRYWHDVVGHNFRLTNLQAALGVAQLDNLSTIIENKSVLNASTENV